jgi:hypothetical protein
MMKILALVLALVMMTSCLAACGKDTDTSKNSGSANETKGTEPQGTEPQGTEPQGTEPEGTEPTTPPDDGKKEYKVFVTDAAGNPLTGVTVQICKDGSTCFNPIKTNEQGVAVWLLDDADDYYGTVSSVEEGMPKVYFGDDYEVTLVYGAEKDSKKEYKIIVTDSEGNPLSGILVQICKEGSTCFIPTRTNDQGFATWKLDEAADYYGTVSSIEEGMPKEYFGDKFEVSLVYNPPVAE